MVIIKYIHSMKTVKEGLDLIITSSFDVKTYEPSHNDAWEDAYQRFLSICGKEF